MISTLWRELQTYLAGRSSRLLKVSALAVVSGLSEAAALFFVVRVVVDIGSGNETVHLGQIVLSVRDSLLIAAGAETLAVLCHVLIARTTAAIGATVLTETRRIAISRYVRAPWGIQSVQREGALQELVTSLSVRTSDLAQWVANGLCQTLMLSMFIFAALVVDWRFTIVILLAGTGLVLLVRPLGKTTQVRSRAFVDANSFYAEEVGRLASSTMELDSFGVGHRAEAQLAVVNNSVGERQYRAKSMAAIASNIFKDAAVFLLIGSVGGLYLLGRNALASAGVVITLIIRSLASAQQASAAYQLLSEASPNLIALNERLERMSEEPLPQSGLEIRKLDSIRFQDVSYTYEDAETPALADVSLEIRSGDFVGVVGPSGGGKSTLLQLMLRLRRPTSGEILLNGHDYREVAADEWHDLVSLVPQEPSLLEATIAENISYYRPMTFDSIRDAARAANILDEIMRLPLGFQTRLGPRGTGLSGGQKQRIAIARALAGKPSLLVMDEPTSALDAGAETAVLDTILSLRGSTTMVLVAHRLSTVERCDYLVQVDGGRVKRP